MKINVDEITNLIKQEIDQHASVLEVSQVVQVVEVGDGIARVYGLSKAMAGELLDFEVGDGETVSGQVFNLEHDVVGTVLFGEYLKVKEGMTVRATVLRLCLEIFREERRSRQATLYLPRTEPVLLGSLPFWSNRNFPLRVAPERSCPRIEDS